MLHYCYKNSNIYSGRNIQNQKQLDYMLIILQKGIPLKD